MDSFAILSGFGIGAFRYQPAVAMGTELWFAALTKAGGAVARAWHGRVHKRITVFLMAGSLPAALATIATMHLTGFGTGWTRELTLALGAALLLTASVVAHRPAWQALGLKLGALLVGSLPGIWTGAQLMKRLPERVARTLPRLSLVTPGLNVVT